MSVHRGFDRLGPPSPRDRVPDQSVVRIDELMDQFRRSTDIRPSGDLLAQVRVRVSAEPPSTAPRRFVTALRAFHVPGIWRGLIQNAQAAFAPGTRSMLLRIQALSIVVVVGTTGLGSVAALAAAARVVNEIRAPAITDQLDGPTEVGTPRVQAADGLPARSEAQTGGQEADAVEPVAVRPAVAGPQAGTAGKPGSAPGVTASDQARSDPNGKRQGKSGAKGKSSAKGKSGAKGKPSSARRGSGMDKARIVQAKKADRQAGSPGKGDVAKPAKEPDKAGSDPNGGQAAGRIADERSDGGGADRLRRRGGDKAGADEPSA